MWWCLFGSVSSFILLDGLVFFEGSCDNPYLHLLTHSFPTRRSSDLGAFDEPRPGALYAEVRQALGGIDARQAVGCLFDDRLGAALCAPGDRKSTRLNSSH